MHIHIHTKMDIWNYAKQVRKKRTGMSRECKAVTADRNNTKKKKMPEERVREKH